MDAQKVIKERQSATKTAALLDGFSSIRQKEFENQLKEIENGKVRKNAEMVYMAYLHCGEEVANERKALYLERNLLK